MSDRISTTAGGYPADINNPDDWAAFLARYLDNRVTNAVHNGIGLVALHIVDAIRDARAQTTADYACTFDADLLAMASSFDLIPFNPNGPWWNIRELKVERRRINPEAWSIGSEGKVLLRDGMWVLEPRPSERDDDFLAKARWPTARDAIAFARHTCIPAA